MLSNPESRIPPRAIWTLGGIALFSVGMYLLFSGGNSHIGFPLDDAWIHQTYARTAINWDCPPISGPIFSERLFCGGLLLSVSLR
jgi:hypothetical protein